MRIRYSILIIPLVVAACASSAGSPSAAAPSVAAPSEAPLDRALGGAIGGALRCAVGGSSTRSTHSQHSATKR